jgi:hypothetical protein
LDACRSFIFSRSANLKSPSIFNFSNKTSKATTKRNNLQSIQKQIEKNFSESDLKISVYEFRETIERYVGLTLINQSNATVSRVEDEEFLRAAQVSNVELGAICLNRRNQNKLSLHQTEARKDFLHTINQLLRFGSDEKSIEQSAVKLVAVLEDRDVHIELEKMFTHWRQTGKQLNVARNGE